MSEKRENRRSTSTASQRNARRTSVTVASALHSVDMHFDSDGYISMHRSRR